MSSPSTEEVVKKSSGWWPFAAPLAVALVLFLLVGTIFENRIETALRNFVERQRLRLFSRSNEQPAATQPTNTTPSTPTRSTAQSCTKYSPAQTIVSINHRQPFELDVNKIQLNNEQALTERLQRNDINEAKFDIPKIVQDMLKISNDDLSTFNEEFGRLDVEDFKDIDNILSKDKDATGVTIYDRKKAVMLKVPEVVDSDVDLASAYTSMSREFDIKTQNPLDKIDKRLTKISSSGSNINKVSQFVCKRPDLCKKSESSTDTSVKNWQRPNKEISHPASNLYS